MTEHNQEDLQAEAEAKASKLAEKAKELAEQAKVSLEMQIAGREVTVKIDAEEGKTIVKLKKWGLSKKLRLGSIVTQLVNHIGNVMPNTDFNDPAIQLQLMGQLAEQVIEIVAETMVSPGNNVTERFEWLEDNVNPEELVNLAIVVYDMNMGGESAKKFQKGAKALEEKINSALRT